MKIQFYSLLCLPLLLIGCKKKFDSPSDGVKLISDQKFENGLLIDGHQFDSLLIQNCTFTNQGLEIRNADHVRVVNCEFTTIKGNGITVGFGGEAKYVEIEECFFSSIAGNGIDSHEDAFGGTIRKCQIEFTGLSEIGAAFGQSHHGIYWKAGGVTIVDNIIHDVVNEGGNGISLRSDGVVRRNIIFNSKKSGITYFSDHPAVNDTLLFENNMIYDNGKSGITVVSNGETENYVGNFIVRFNTIIQNETNFCIDVSSDFNGISTAEFIGNVLISDQERYYTDDIVLKSEYNLSAQTDIGFIDFENRDLHIKASSQANGFANGATFFPVDDFDSDIRTGINLDAGADEID